MKVYEIPEQKVQVRAEKLCIGANVSWGKGTTLEARELEIGCGVVFGNNVTLKAEQSARIASKAAIDDSVTIHAHSFCLGYASRVESGCRIGGMGQLSAETVTIGDMSLIGNDCRIFITRLTVGDYVKIYNHTLINGRKQCSIGHNCYVGQNTILNAEDDLMIGNHVGLGIYSSIWTHAYFGDLLEGCNTFLIKPTIIEDDVWILGAYNVVAPGVHLGAKSMILTHSFVNRDVGANRCVAGIPARDITEKITPYSTVTIDEKFEMMKTYVRQFLDACYPGHYISVPDGYQVQESSYTFEILLLEETLKFASSCRNVDTIIISKESDRQRRPRVTVIDLSRRQYTKWLTRAEIQFLSFLGSYRARFLPEEDPDIQKKKFSMIF